MHEQFLRRAVQLALESVERGGGPFGAVLACHDNPIAEAANEVTRLNDPTAHAEVLAIRRACDTLGQFELTGCDLYTSCEPCPMCLAAAYWARVARIFFAATREDAARAGFDDRLIYDELAVDASSRRLRMEQVPSTDSLAPFESWLKNPNRTPY